MHEYFVAFYLKDLNKSFGIYYQMVAVACSPSLYFLKAEAECINIHLPNNGLSEVTGIVADTMFKNTVRLRRIVTPGMKSNSFYCISIFFGVFASFAFFFVSHARYKSATFVRLIHLN